jgi:hypothetical protein
MTDPNEFEIQAMSNASDRAGEYIESIGRTDMAVWTEEEWTRFIETVCGGYVDKLCDLQAQANDALNKVRA